MRQKYLAGKTWFTHEAASLISIPASSWAEITITCFFSIWVIYHKLVTHFCLLRSPPQLSHLWWIQSQSIKHKCSNSARKCLRPWWSWSWWSWSRWWWWYSLEAFVVPRPTTFKADFKLHSTSDLTCARLEISFPNKLVRFEIIWDVRSFEISFENLKYKWGSLAALAAVSIKTRSIRDVFNLLNIYFLNHLKCSWTQVQVNYRKVASWIGRCFLSTSNTWAKC